MKYIYLLIIITLFFSFGCSKKNNNNETSKEVPSIIKDDRQEQYSDISVNTEEAEKMVAEAEKLTGKDIPEKAKKEIAAEIKKADEEIKKIPPIKLDTNKVKLEWADDTGKVMTCVAKKFHGNQIHNVLSLEDFTAYLYENGKLSAKFTAKKASLDISKKEIKALTGVRVVSLANKTVLTANKVLWKSDINTIYANDAILSGELGKISGKYFTLDTKLEIFQVSDTGLNIK